MKHRRGRCISSVCMAVFLLFLAMGVAWADATFSNGNLHLHAVNVPGDGLYEAQLRATDDTGQEFELVGAAQVSPGAATVATFESEIGILHIPKLEMNGVSNATKYVEVDMKLVPDSDPMRFVVMGVHGKQLGFDDRGPQGPQGPQGPMGPQGPSGIIGYEIITNVINCPGAGLCEGNATCPPGKKVYGGGADFIVSFGAEVMPTLNRSSPVSNNSWGIMYTFEVGTSGSGTVKAICGY